MHEFEKIEQAADDLTAEVMAFVGTTDRNKVVCPREKSSMTPCVARDGRLAVADSGVCVGCGRDPRVLLKDHREKHPVEQKGSEG